MSTRRLITLEAIAVLVLEYVEKDMDADGESGNICRS